MIVIYFLIGCSIVIATGFLIAFIWAMRSGQNDDLETPAMRMLFDDEVSEVLKDKGKKNK